MEKLEIRKNKKPIGLILLKGRTFIALFVLLVYFSIFSPNFLSTQSLILVAKHVALYGILAVGMTAVIISGGIDLSVGSIVGLSGMIAGGLIHQGLVLNWAGMTIYFNVAAIIIITLIIGVLAGLFNGILISRLNVAPFIATLGSLYMARGFAMLRSGGATFPNLVGSPERGNTGFEFLGSGTLIGIPIAIWLMVAIAAVAAYVFKKTPLGWHILAVGGNEKAAELSGVKIKNIKLYVYMFSGLCAALVGLITTSQLVASHPASGETWEMNAIAAAVLGGTSMSGGVGTIGGTIVGAFVIGVLNDGMIMMGVSQFWQMVIKGCVIVVAVVVDQFQRRLQAKLALQNAAST